MSIALDTTIALVDLATAKTFLNIPTATLTHDDILHLSINAASDFAIMDVPIPEVTCICLR